MNFQEKQIEKGKEILYVNCAVDCCGIFSGSQLSCISNEKLLFILGVFPAS